MKKMLREVSFSSLLTALIGLVLFLIPGLTNWLIVRGIGIVLLVYGIFRVVRYVRREATAAMIDHDLSAGLICAVSGLFMLVYSEVVISILPFLFGLFLVFGGAASIQTAFDVRRFRGERWNLHLGIGILFVLLGIIAIRDPFKTAAALTRFVGICLLVQGIYRFLAARRVKKLRDAFMARP